MKKVKIMLLSLALFAVVGGALAFKAKNGHDIWCAADAYFNSGSTPQYYCSFDTGNQVFTTTTGQTFVQETKFGTGTQKLCTTVTNGANTDALCTTLVAPNITSLTHD